MFAVPSLGRAEAVRTRGGATHKAVGLVLDLLQAHRVTPWQGPLMLQVRVVGHKATVVCGGLQHAKIIINK